MPSVRIIEILSDLVRFPSVSSTENRSISNYVTGLLKQLGLNAEQIVYQDRDGAEKVNLLATAGPACEQGGLAYCAHTDVVPVSDWSFEASGPFDLHQADQKLYGRGSCDMKGSLACFLVAMESVDLSQLRSPLSIICTADEETGYQGASQVAQRSKIFRTLCKQQPLTIIGEPTSLQVIHAHKGIYSFKATSHGRAAHSSTLEGINANLKMIPFLQEMKQIYDETLSSPAWQHEAFSPTGISWNIGINDFIQAVNITPEQSVCTVSFRPMPDQPADALLKRASEAAEKCGLDFEILCQAPPVFVDENAAHIQQMLELTGNEKSHTVSYGTDAAMFLELKNLVICGPGDIAQAHTDDEWIDIDQLHRGVDLYRRAIEKFCL